MLQEAELLAEKMEDAVQVYKHKHNGAPPDKKWLMILSLSHWASSFCVAPLTA